MKKAFLIIVAIFVLASSVFAADSTFEKDLQDFVQLVKNNAGWYFYEWGSYSYMDMYYIDIGQASQDLAYYVMENRYTINNYKTKTLRLSSSGGNPYIRNEKTLNEEKKRFTVENGKVKSIMMYDSYLIKTDCKNEKEAAEYLYKKIDERMSSIAGKYYDQEKGVSIEISKSGENFIVTVTDKAGTSNTYEMFYWDSATLYGSKDNTGHFLKLSNGKFSFSDMDEYEHVTIVGNFNTSAIKKAEKSIETELDDSFYDILSTTQKSVSLGTWSLKYLEAGKPEQTETVYRVYEKDGWKRIDFNDIKIQIIDGEYKSIAFQFTADSLKNDKSLESGIFVKNPQKVDETNGYLIKNLKASSTLTDKYHTYSADGMLKVYAKNPNSENLYYQQASAPKFWVRDNIPWVEGKTGDGIGEYIEFDLYPSTDYRHDKYRIRILNGYVNPLLPHLFKENNRIKTATVETDKGYKDTISFEDVVEFTDFFIPMKKDDPTHVKITIDEVYKGSKYSDTSITALEANYQLWEK
ncbi:MAG: hypothetical protein J5647_01705 [Spirochaetaceae bacterium]|nr:hypothetical protein [Spirochaetaceae bacterium]